MIVAAEWIFPITSPALSHHAIEVDQGIIRDIRPLRSSDPFYPGTCLLPGLINAHTHLAYTALRNLFDDLPFFPWIRQLTETKYQKLTENDIIASTRLGILETILSGITTVADLSDLEPSLRTLSLSPLRGIFYWEVFGVENEEAQKSWSDLQVIYPRLQEQYGTERLRIGISPHSCYTVRPELFRQIAEWANEKRIPVSFHLAESREEEEFVRSRSGPIADFLNKRSADWTFYGKSSVSHLETTGIFQTKPLVAHLVQVKSSDIRTLKNYDVSIAHCPKSNAKFGHGTAPLDAFIRGGFPVGIATDSAASNNRFDLFEEIRFALFQQRAHKRRKILRESQMLEMITIEAARAMRMQDRIGSIERGKEADLIAVRIPPYYMTASQVLRHLIYNTTATDVQTTFIHGNPINLEEIHEEIRRIYTKMEERV